MKSSIVMNRSRLLLYDVIWSFQRSGKSMNQYKCLRFQNYFFLENMNLIITWTVTNVHKNNKPLKSIGFDDIFVFFRKFFLFTKYLFVSRFCLLVLISKSQLLRHEFPPGWVQEQTINEHFTLEFFSVPQNPFVWFVCRQSLCQPNHTLFEKQKTKFFWKTLI